MWLMLPLTTHKCSFFLPLFLHSISLFRNGDSNFFSRTHSINCLFPFAFFLAGVVVCLNAFINSKLIFIPALNARNLHFRIAARGAYWMTCKMCRSNRSSKRVKQKESKNNEKYWKLFQILHIDWMEDASFGKFVARIMQRERERKTTSKNLYTDNGIGFSIELEIHAKCLQQFDWIIVYIIASLVCWTFVIKLKSAGVFGYHLGKRLRWKKAGLR